MFKWREFSSDQRGIAAIELGLLLGLIAVAAVSTFSTLGGAIDSSFNVTSNKVAEAS